MRKYFYLICSAIFLLSVISCKKDELDFFGISKAEFSELKSFYERTLRVSMLEGHGPFASLTPNWRNVEVISNGDETVYEIKMSNPERLSLNFYDQKGEDVKQREFRLLVFKDNVLNKMSYGNIVSVNSYDDSNLNQIHYTKYGSFNGFITFFHMNGYYYNTWFLKNGRNAARGGRGLQSNQNLSEMDGRISYILPDLECSYETVNLMGWACVDAGSTSGPVCREYVKFSYEVRTCPNPSTPGETGNNPPPGGGYVPPNYEMPEILDLLEDSCLKIALSKARNSEMMNEINDIIQNLVKDDEVKIKVFDSRGLKSQSGQIVAAKHGNAGFDFEGVYNADIILNLDVMESASQEYAVSTIMHEALHAYFRKTAGPGLVNDDRNFIHHNDMVTLYFMPMVNFIRNIYGGLTYKSAAALVWDGLEGTNLYNSYKVNNSFPTGLIGEFMSLTEMQNYQSMHKIYNNNYPTGTTRCAQ